MPGPCRRRAALGWRSALALSLALHGLGLGVVAGLPCRVPRPHPFCLGPVVEPLQGEGAEEPSCYLVRRPRSAPKPVSTPSNSHPDPPEAPARAPVHQPQAPAQVTLHKPEAPARAAPPPPAPGPGGEREGTTSGGPGGPPHGPGTAGGTTFFQVPTRAEKVVYVIDRSMSMGLHGALEAARRELLTSLEQLPPTTRFQVIVFNSTAGPLIPSQPQWLEATAANRQLVARALADLPAEGGTNHDLALPKALALQPDVIFFLTDADDLTAAQLRSITLHNRGRTVIHTIELNTANRGRPQMPLQLLARENGGVYQAVDPRHYP